MKDEKNKNSTLPSSWTNTSVGDICDFEYGKALKQDIRNEDGPYQVYGSNGIVGNHDQYIIEGPCVIIGRKGAAGAVHHSNLNCWPIDTTYFIRRIESLNIRFIYYQLLNLNLSSLEKSTAIPGLNRNDAYEKIFLLPPLNEQNRIVEKLDELLSELEKGKEQLLTSLEQLKVYRQSILKHAFEGKLTEEWRSNQKKLKTPDELVTEIKAYRKEQYEKQLKEYKAGKIKVKPKEPKEIIPLSPSEINTLKELPNGWTYVKVSSLGDIETGTTPSKAKPEYFGNKYPFYKPTELDAGFNVREAKEYLSESGIKQARFLPINSILVTSIGATIGKTGIIRVAGASNQQINAIVPHEIFNPNFLYFQAVSQFFQEQILSNAVATTLPILNKSKFEKLVFAICSLEEQNTLVDEIERNFSNCDNMEETLIQNIQVSNSLRQSLLQKAFEGKLVEQDPKDEPASALLERIKKEREEFLKAEKGKRLKSQEKKAQLA